MLLFVVFLSFLAFGQGQQSNAPDFLPPLEPNQLNPLFNGNQYGMDYTESAEQFDCSMIRHAARCVKDKRCVWCVVQEATSDAVVNEFGCRPRDHSGRNVHCTYPRFVSGNKTHADWVAPDSPGDSPWWSSVGYFDRVGAASQPCERFANQTDVDLALSAGIPVNFTGSSDCSLVHETLYSARGQIFERQGLGSRAYYHSRRILVIPPNVTVMAQANGLDPTMPDPYHVQFDAEIILVFGSVFCDAPNCHVSFNARHTFVYGSVLARSSGGAANATVSFGPHRGPVSFNDTSLWVLGAVVATGIRVTGMQGANGLHLSGVLSTSGMCRRDCGAPERYHERALAEYANFASWGGASAGAGGPGGFSHARDFPSAVTMQAARARDSAGSLEYCGCQGGRGYMGSIYDDVARSLAARGWPYYNDFEEALPSLLQGRATTNTIASGTLALHLVSTAGGLPVSAYDDPEASDDAANTAAQPYVSGGGLGGGWIDINCPEARLVFQQSVIRVTSADSIPPSDATILYNELGMAEIRNPMIEANGGPGRSAVDIDTWPVPGGGGGGGLVRVRVLTSTMAPAAQHVTVTNMDGAKPLVSAQGGQGGNSLMGLDPNTAVMHPYGFNESPDGVLSKASPPEFAPAGGGGGGGRVYYHILEYDESSSSTPVLGAEAGWGGDLLFPSAGGTQEPSYRRLINPDVFDVDHVSTVGLETGFSLINFYGWPGFTMSTLTQGGVSSGGLTVAGPPVAYMIETVHCVRGALLPNDGGEGSDQQPLVLEADWKFPPSFDYETNHVEISYAMRFGMTQMLRHSFFFDDFFGLYPPFPDAEVGLADTIMTRGPSPLKGLLQLSPLDFKDEVEPNQWEIIPGMYLNSLARPAAINMCGSFHVASIWLDPLSVIGCPSTTALPRWGDQAEVFGDSGSNTTTSTPTSTIGPPTSDAARYESAKEYARVVLPMFSTEALTAADRLEVHSTAPAPDSNLGFLRDFTGPYNTHPDVVAVGNVLGAVVIDGFSLVDVHCLLEVSELTVTDSGEVRIMQQDAYMQKLRRLPVVPLPVRSRLEISLCMSNDTYTCRHMPTKIVLGGDLPFTAENGYERRHFRQHWPRRYELNDMAFVSSAVLQADSVEFARNLHFGSSVTESTVGPFYNWADRMALAAGSFREAFRLGRWPYQPLVFVEASASVTVAQDALIQATVFAAVNWRSMEVHPRAVIDVSGGGMPAGVPCDPFAWHTPMAQRGQQAAFPQAYAVSSGNATTDRCVYAVVDNGVDETTPLSGSHSHMGCGPAELRADPFGSPSMPASRGGGGNRLGDEQCWLCPSTDSGLPDPDSSCCVYDQAFPHHGWGGGVIFLASAQDAAGAAWMSGVDDGDGAERYFTADSGVRANEYTFDLKARIQVQRPVAGFPALQPARNVTTVLRMAPSIELLANGIDGYKVGGSTARTRPGGAGAGGSLYLSAVLVEFVDGLGTQENPTTNSVADALRPVLQANGGVAPSSLASGGRLAVRGSTGCSDVRNILAETPKDGGGTPMSDQETKFQTLFRSGNLNADTLTELNGLGCPKEQGQAAAWTLTRSLCSGWAAGDCSFDYSVLQSVEPPVNAEMDSDMDPVRSTELKFPDADRVRVPVHCGEETVVVVPRYSNTALLRRQFGGQSGSDAFPRPCLVYGELMLNPNVTITSLEFSLENLADEPMESTINIVPCLHENRCVYDTGSDTLDRDYGLSDRDDTNPLYQFPQEVIRRFDFNYLDGYDAEWKKYAENVEAGGGTDECNKGALCRGGVDCTESPQDPNCYQDCNAQPYDPLCQYKCQQNPGESWCTTFVDCSQGKDQPGCPDCGRAFPTDPRCSEGGPDCSSAPNIEGCPDCGRANPTDPRCFSGGGGPDCSSAPNIEGCPDCGRANPTDPRCSSGGGGPDCSSAPNIEGCPDCGRFTPTDPRCSSGGGGPDCSSAPNIEGCPDCGAFTPTDPRCKTAADCSGSPAIAECPDCNLEFPTDPRCTTNAPPVDCQMYPKDPACPDCHLKYPTDPSCANYGGGGSTFTPDCTSSPDITGCPDCGLQYPTDPRCSSSGKRKRHSSLAATGKEQPDELGRHTARRHWLAKRQDTSRCDPMAGTPINQYDSESFADALDVLKQCFVGTFINELAPGEEAQVPTFALVRGPNYDEALDNLDRLYDYQPVGSQLLFFDNTKFQTEASEEALSQMNQNMMRKRTSSLSSTERRRSRRRDHAGKRQLAKMLDGLDSITLMEDRKQWLSDITDEVADGELTLDAVANIRDLPAVLRFRFTPAVCPYNTHHRLANDTDRVSVECPVKHFPPSDAHECSLDEINDADHDVCAPFFEQACHGEDARKLQGCLRFLDRRRLSGNPLEDLGDDVGNSNRWPVYRDYAHVNYSGTAEKSQFYICVPNAGTWSFLGGYAPRACSELFCGANSYGDCTLHRTGPVCSLCESGYYPLKNECVECPQTVGLQLGLFIVGCVVAMGLIAYFGERIPGKALTMSQLNFYQVLSVFFAINLEWTPTLVQFFSFLSYFTLSIDAASPECVFGAIPYASKYMLYMIGPAALAVVFFGVRLVAWKWTRARRGVVTGYFQAFLFAYLILAKKAFEPFDCTYVPDLQKAYMDAESTIECSLDNQRWAPLLFASIAGVIVYLLMCPAYIVFRLRGSRLDKADKDFQATWGFMYQSFDWQRKYFFAYWKILIALRKLLLVMVVLFAPGPAQQSAGGLCVIAAALVLHLLFRPWADRKVVILEAVNLFASLIILASGLATGFEDLVNLDVDLNFSSDAVTAVVLSLFGISTLMYAVFMFITVKDQARDTVRARSERRETKRLSKLGLTAGADGAYEMSDVGDGDDKQATADALAKLEYGAVAGKPGLLGKRSASSRRSGRSRKASTAKPHASDITAALGEEDGSGDDAGDDRTMDLAALKLAIQEDEAAHGKPDIDALLSDAEFPVEDPESIEEESAESSDRNREPTM